MQPYHPGTTGARLTLTLAREGCQLRDIALAVVDLLNIIIVMRRQGDSPLTLDNAAAGILSAAH